MFQDIAMHWKLAVWFTKRLTLANQQQMRDKFPPQWRILPPSVSQSTAIDSFPLLRQKLLALQPGTSPGCGGCRPEFLIALGERLEDGEIDLFGQLCLAYTAALLPPLSSGCDAFTKNGRLFQELLIWYLGFDWVLSNSIFYKLFSWIVG